MINERNVKSTYSCSELMAATRSKEYAKVKEILEAVPPLAEASEDEIPYICSVAETGSFSLLRYVVEYSRASLNVYDSSRRNVLHYAVNSGSCDCVKYLVERCGLNPLEADSSLLTPYELSYRNRGASADESDLKKEQYESVYSYLEQYIGTPFTSMYRNPIRTGFFPDPSIVRVGEDYYSVNSSFIFFPCIPVSHSTDLVNWEIIGHAITNPEWSRLGSLEGGRGYWAPDISYDNGYFYITATYRLNDDGMPYRLQMVTRSKTPEGPYCEPVFLNEDGIDPSLFHEDGRHYMLLNRGARIFELNEDCTEIISEPTLLYYGDMKRAPEGPHLLKKDGYYYLFEAEGGTGPGHRETVSRSRSLFGPYEPCPYNPILRREDTGAPITRCGHAKPVSTPDGRWFMVYLCGRRYNGEYTFLGRETALDEITWTPDGWPIVNKGRGPSYLAPLPIGNKTNIVSRSSAEPFRLEDYFTPREPERDFCSVRKFKTSTGRCSDRTEILLASSPAPLNDVAAGNILLRRQTSFDFLFRATVDLDYIPSLSEAGITCYYDENSFITFSAEVSPSIGGPDYCHIHLFMQNGDKEFYKNLPILPLTGEGERITLGVEVHGLSRRFFFTTSGFEEGSVKDGSFTLKEVTCLSDEGVKMGKRFTGACVGMYARGGEHFRARFSDIEYENLQI